MLDGLSVFVSHSSEDNIWCRSFVQELRQSGANVWYDEHDLAPTALPTTLANEIAKRPIFVAILSPHAINSGWVQLEINIAMSFQVDEPHRVLLPVVVAETSIPSVLRIFTRVTGPHGGGLSPLEAARRVIDALSEEKLGEERLALLERRSGVPSLAHVKFAKGYAEGWLAALNNVWDLLEYSGVGNIANFVNVYEHLSSMYDTFQEWRDNPGGESNAPPNPPPFPR